MLMPFLTLPRHSKRPKYLGRKALSGARIHSILARLGIDDEEPYQFLAEVQTNCKKNGLSAEDLVAHSIAFFRFSESVDLPLDQLEDHCQSLIDKKKNHEYQIAKLEKDLMEAKSRQKDALENEGLTLKTIQDYARTKKELKNKGVPVEDLPRLGAMLDEVSSLGFDANKVRVYLNWRGS